MKGIRTSYVSNPKLKYEFNVAIVANKMVNSLGWRHAKEFAPPWDLVQAWKSQEIGLDEFRSEYRRRVLDKLNVHEMYLKYKGYILACFEKDASICHRTFIAEWFRQGGYEVEEM